MKASVLTNYGSPDCFELQEVTRPVPKDNDVSIKVHATSINSWDGEILNGRPFINRLMVGLRKPTKMTILDCDIAGRIEAVGKYVTQFKPGVRSLVISLVVVGVGWPNMSVCRQIKMHWC